MLHTTSRATRSIDVRMLAAADRLFNEFEDLPVRTVFRAIGDARATVRESDGVATPEAIERLARDRLLALVPAIA